MTRVENQLPQVAPSPPRPIVIGWDSPPRKANDQDELVAATPTASSVEKSVEQVEGGLTPSPPRPIVIGWDSPPPNANDQDVSVVPPLPASPLFVVGKTISATAQVGATISPALSAEASKPANQHFPTTKTETDPVLQIAFSPALQALAALEKSTTIIAAGFVTPLQAFVVKMNTAIETCSNITMHPETNESKKAAARKSFVTNMQLLLESMQKTISDSKKHPVVAMSIEKLIAILNLIFRGLQHICKKWNVFQDTNFAKKQWLIEPSAQTQTMSVVQLIQKASTVALWKVAPIRQAVEKEVPVANKRSNFI